MMPKVVKIFLLLNVCFWGIIPSRSGGTETDAAKIDELRKQVEFIVAGNETALGAIKSGRGIVTVRWSAKNYEYEKDEKSWVLKKEQKSRHKVEFWHKGDKVRSEESFFREGEETPLQTSIYLHLPDKKWTYGVGETTASIDEPRPLSLTTAPVPQAFFPHHGIDLDYYLNRLLSRVQEGAVEMKISEMEDGLFRIFIKTIEGSDYGEEYIEFDPQKGFVITRMESFDRSELLKRERTDRYECEWKDYGNGIWYPVKLNTSTVTVDDGERKEVIETTLVVESYEPNVPVSDDLFTAASLGMKPGTEIYDNIVGINYRYKGGSQKELEEELKNLAKGIEVPPAVSAKAEERGTSEKPGTTEPATEPTAVIIGQKTILWPYLLGGFGILVLIIFFVAYLRRWKGRHI